VPATQTIFEARGESSKIQYCDLHSPRRRFSTMTDAEKQIIPADLSLERLICSSFPPLDPNGQPFSMTLRGIAADLGELRCTLSSYPTAREQLQVELKKNTDSDCNPVFGDVEEDQSSELETTGLQGGHGSNAHQRVEETEHMGDRNRNVESTGTKKRGRGVEADDSGSEDEENCDDGTENREQLILYLPFIRCTCSSWNMKGVSGDLFVTSLRVFFLPEKEDGTEQSDDVAIDGCAIALHAVDSVPPSDGDNYPVVSHHVYCQLADPAGDDGDIGYTSATSMVAPTEIAEEKCDPANDDGDVQAEEEEEDGISTEDSTVEIYFQPMNSDAGEDDHSPAECSKCQTIFESLTKLVSLNPAGDTDGGFGSGGLFSMLSLMDGINNRDNGFDGEMMFANHDDDSDDDMVFRLGGSNNLVENDDESEGAPEDEREAMLRRLDDMLVVPPEYEVASSEDGQFEDAEEDDLDDGVL